MTKPSPKPSEPHPAARFRPHESNPHKAFSTHRRAPDASAALIFLDTNVLLAPYKNSKEALEAIKTTYSRLIAGDRLLIPAQVAREFAHNRPALITALHKQVSDARTHAMSGRFDAAPILHGLPEYQTASAALKSIESALKQYRKAMSELAESIARWQSDDPVLRAYEQLFGSSRIVESTLDSDAIEAIRKPRYDARIPPGFRDKGKSDGGIGDLAIWLTIMDTCKTRQQDGILVTEDSKDDWFHNSGEQRLFPRYELVEEFAAYVPGRSFGIMHLADLLKAHGVAEKVVTQVAERERHALTSSRKLPSYSYALSAVMTRIGALLGDNDELEQSPGFPDIRVRVDGKRIGLSVIALLRNGVNMMHPQQSAMIEAAQHLVRQGQFAEVAIVFVAFDQATARGFGEWFSDARFRFYNVSIIVIDDHDQQFKTIINQSTNPLLQLTFPPT